MRRKLLSISLTAVVLTIGACSGDPKFVRWRKEVGDSVVVSAGDATLTLAGLKKRLLGAAIDSLPALADWPARDTVLEGDEGLSWKGRAWYSERQLVLLAEADWEDTRRIHRITVFGPQIKEGALFVGQLEMVYPAFGGSFREVGKNINKH